MNSKNFIAITIQHRIVAAALPCLPSASQIPARPSLCVHQASYPQIASAPKILCITSSSSHHTNQTPANLTASPLHINPSCHHNPASSTPPSLAASSPSSKKRLRSAMPSRKSSSASSEPSARRRVS